MGTIIMWVVGLTAAVALVAGPAAAVSVAGDVEHTLGVSVGAIVSGSDDLVNGFKQAKADANNAPSHAAHARRHH
jgi:hypothetical protein